MTTVGIGLGCYQADTNRGHDITFLLTLTITHRAMSNAVIILHSFLH
jgi:hypothetical protein